MTYTLLKDLSLEAIKQANELKIIIEEEGDTEKIALINQKILEGMAVFLHFKDYKTPVEKLVANFPNAEHLRLSPPYEFPLENIDFLQDMNLKTLYLGMYVKKNASFKALETNSLENFSFEGGLAHKSQYDFINRQKNLQKLHLKGLDLNQITPLPITDLYIRSTLKAENLLCEKFSHLKKLRLHGLSRLTDHSFVENLAHLEQIEISYNSHLERFPRLKNPHLVRSIQMYTCPNFSDIESLLIYENLERLTLTSHDKSLKMSVEDFIKLKKLKKLRIVYTQWGKISQQKYDTIKNIYEETGWVNSGLVSL